MMNKQKHYFLLCAWVICGFLFAANAQRTLRGTVKDAETGAPVDGANVVVLRGERATEFTLTNERGEFSFSPSAELDTLTLSVSMLGYETFSEKIGARNLFSIKLKPSPIKLKEVTIRPGRIWGRSDTIRFDAAKFLRENDKSVEDLMKRLPGIDVDENGNIRYRGKNIGTMYVEGLDLTGSRYKTISKNITAESVKEVEVLDNHQRIKSLAGKIPSDNTDINIRLKENFKDKWTFTPKLSAGFSPDDFLYESELNALQISRKSQSLYALKLSNTGNCITKEIDAGIDNLLALPDYRLLSDPDVSAPLSERRWLFDNAALFSANRIYRTGEDSRLRFNAVYAHNNITQQTNATTTYFNPSDTLVVEENNLYRLKKDKLALSADFENNSTTYFLRNNLEMELDKAMADSRITGSDNVSQQRSDYALAVRNNLSYNRTLNNGNVVQAKSLVGYWRNNQQLRFADYEQPISLNGFYTRTEGAVVIGKTAIGQQYNAGVVTNFNSLKNLHQVWLSPGYQYSVNSLKLRSSLTANALHIPDNRAFHFLPSASFLADWKINYAWNLRFSAKYGKELGNVTSVYALPHYSDYRNRLESEKDVPFSSRQQYFLRVEYKNTLSEFFANMNIAANRGSQNNTLEQEVRGRHFLWTRRFTPHNESSYGVNGIISKGFYDLGAKASLNASYWHNLSAQIRDGRLHPFSFQTLLLQPKLSLSINKASEISYEGNFQRRRFSFGEESGAGQGLWNMSQKLSGYYTAKGFSVSASGEYVRNEIVDNNAANLFFADAQASYRFSKFSLSLQANNLLNARSYGYTVFNPLSVHSSQLQIRPREILVTFRAAL